MIQYRFDLREAYEQGIREHPQKTLERLNIDYFQYTPAPIGDCIIFTSNKIEELPPYIEEITWV